MFDFIRSTNGSIFINTDLDYLEEMSKGISNKITYGTNHAQTTGRLISSEPFLVVNIDSDEAIGEINTHLVGDYNLPNVLAAVCVGAHFGVPAHKIKAAIENYLPSNSRSQLLEKDSNKIILDAYNANPSSMKLAIENFAKLPAEKKVLMLGAMAELGDESLAEHQAIVDLIQTFKWDNVVLVGGDFAKIAKEKSSNWLSSKKLSLSEKLLKSCIVLYFAFLLRKTNVIFGSKFTFSRCDSKTIQDYYW